jgi:hypothetical protein
MVVARGQRRNVGRGAGCWLPLVQQAQNSGAGWAFRSAAVGPITRARPPPPGTPGQ